MAERSKYQQKVIGNYYRNRESIALQRAQEIISEIYLSEGRKREKHWKTLALHLGKLGIKPDQIERLVNLDDPAMAAKTVKRLLSD